MHIFNFNIFLYKFFIQILKAEKVYEIFGKITEHPDAYAMDLTVGFFREYRLEVYFSIGAVLIREDVMRVGKKCSYSVSEL